MVLRSMRTFICVAALCFASASAAHHTEIHSYLLSWIPATCCVTNDCCWEISERDLKDLGDNRYEVLSTGQVRERTDYSPDGKFYRCACDFDAESRQWIKHQGANTRCIFTPMRMF